MARKTLTPVPAKVVRDFFKSNPTLVPSEAVTSLREKQRGRIHPTAREAFNAANESNGVVYVEGNQKGLVVEFTYRQPSGRKAKASEFVSNADLRGLAGDLAGKRGRLSAAAMERVTESLGRMRTEAAKAAKSK